MKVVILAAGTGSRLDDSEDHKPKALTTLATGKSILQHQLDGLAPYLSVDQVFIVVGYQKEIIMEAFPNLTFVYNPLFEQENTAKSLLRALRKIDEDVLWLNGDVVFNPPIVKKVLEFNRTGMVVNQCAVAEEEVKYRTNPEGKILEVSKKVTHPQGEALGINFYKQADLALLKRSLEQCQRNDYFEKGIESSIQQGQSVWSIPIQESDCAEIDFPEDLVRVNRLMKGWQ